MTDERIDEILGAEEELVPSSGFFASVMDRMRDEAAAPPPIPFPWKLAVPGFVVAAGVFGWTGVEFARRIGQAMPALTLSPVHVAANAARPLEQAGWLVVAAAVSVASWMWSRRLAR